MTRWVQAPAGLCAWLWRHGVVWKLEAMLWCTILFHRFLIGHYYFMLFRAYFMQHTLHEHAITCMLPATFAFA